jgi:hypothetical protein
MHHYGAFREGTGHQPDANKDRHYGHCVKGRNATTQERGTESISTSTLLRGQNQVSSVRPASTYIPMGRQSQAPQTNRHARTFVLPRQGRIGGVLSKGRSRSSLPPLRRGQACERHEILNEDHGDLRLYG